MGDDSSYEEDFSADLTIFPTQDIDLPKKVTKTEESPFKILSMENIVQDVFEMVMKVQSFLAVRIYFNFFFFIFSRIQVWQCKKNDAHLLHFIVYQILFIMTFSCFIYNRVCYVWNHLRMR